MRRLTRLPLVFAAILFAACDEDPVAPLDLVIEPALDRCSSATPCA